LTAVKNARAAAGEDGSMRTKPLLRGVIHELAFSPAVSAGVLLKPAFFREDLTVLFDLLQKKKLKPIVARRFPLAEARQAQEQLGNAGVIGKFVLVHDGSRSSSDTHEGARPS
jgi:NADPH:quinone reductase-like Zn-dependent oxidoreductase